jgi:hypothetical protein
MPFMVQKTTSKTFKTMKNMKDMKGFQAQNLIKTPIANSQQLIANFHPNLTFHILEDYV